MLPKSMDAAGDRATSHLLREVTAPKRRATVLLIGVEPSDSERITSVLNERHWVAEVFACEDCETAATFVETRALDLVIVGTAIIEPDSVPLIDLQASSHSALPIVVVVDAFQRKTKVRALTLGAIDFIDRPFDSIDVATRVSTVLNQQTHPSGLAREPASPNDERDERIEQLKASRQDLLFCLARSGEPANSDSNMHLMRVGMYVGAISEQMGFAPAQVEMLEQAALLHDVGKLRISDLILLKPSELTEREYERMKQHCEFGRDIIRSAMDANWRVLGCYRKNTFPEHAADQSLLTVAAQIAYSHHERWDGTGYPQGLAGEEIPIEARITAVADVFDALSSRRPYKSAFMPHACVDIIREERGKHFDPRVVDAFLACRDRLWSIRQDFEPRNTQR